MRTRHFRVKIYEAVLPSVLPEELLPLMRIDEVIKLAYLPPGETIVLEPKDHNGVRVEITRIEGEPS